jgi:hypothetical protein
MATTLSVPNANVEVTQLANSETRTTPVQPGIAVPLEVKSTVPEGWSPNGEATVAVIVTCWPKVEGFGVLVAAVVV